MLAALHHRDRTGEGQHVDQSQAESSMHAIGVTLAESSLGAPAPDRLANGDPAMCPHDAYACAGDDQWVAIAVRDDADWRALAAELGRSDWRDLDLAARRARQAEIDRVIAAWTQGREAPDVESLLQRAGVPAHAVLNAELSREDAQLAHRGHFQTTEHADHRARGARDRVREEHGLPVRALGARDREGAEARRRRGARPCAPGRAFGQIQQIHLTYRTRLM